MNATGFATDEAKWSAVAARDAHADGQFVYAVCTTGVYCRPSCPSRRPRRANVRFFSDGRSAARAGFRACRKCAGRTDSLPAAVQQACRIIEDADVVPSLAVLAEAVGLSPSHLHRRFVQSVGVTPRAYADSLRTRRLQDALASNGSVTRAIHAAGYNSASRVYQNTSRILGMTPSEYGNGAAGVRVRYAIAPCSLGWLLVAATDRGICLTRLGDGPEPLEKALILRFPNAEQLDDDPQLSDWVSQVVGLVEEPGRVCDLPLDIRGTVFQRQVWEALCSIPAGKTSSYAAIAQQIGRPKAVRAVGNACGSNPVAPIIPCHRVLASNGSLGGYGFGLERKRSLLARERSNDQ